VAEKYSNYPLLDFSGGVNLSASRLTSATKDCVTIENGELDKTGRISKVRGYKQRGTDVSTGYDVLGAIGAYKPSTGTLKQIVVADGIASSDAYTFNPITYVWTPHGLSLTLGAKAEFESFLDGFFMVNFSDATRWNNLTQWYTTTNVTNAAKARYIKQYKSRIYLGYVTSGGTTYPSRITYSDLPAGSPLTIGWDDSLNYFDVDNDDADVIKGLEVNADRLLIFKENSLHRYDTNSRYKIPGAPGTVSQRTIKNVEGITFYLHSTGIWGYNGTSSSLLSRKIQDIIEGMSTKNFNMACAGVIGDHYYLYVGDINNARRGLTITNCLIDYDIARDTFSWRSLLDDPTIFFVCRDRRLDVTYDEATVTYDTADEVYDGTIEAVERLYFGTVDGCVHQFNTSRLYDTSDISFTMETQDLFLGQPSNYKLLQKLFFYTHQGVGIHVHYRLDDKDWKTLGRVDKEEQVLDFPAAARCQKVRFKVTEMSGGDPFSFEGLDLFYQVEGLVE